MAKRCRRICFMTAFLIICTAITAQATVPYETYNYSSDGTVCQTPDAYIPARIIDSDKIGMGKITSPGDICTDSHQNVYISDTGNNRILCLDSNFNFVREISSFTYKGKTQTFRNPDGLFIGKDNLLYIADTDNGRVVALDSENNAKRILGRPDVEQMDKSVSYRPVAITVDNYGRVIVVADGVNLGMIVFDSEDNFQTFLGAQKVTYNAADYFFKKFMSDQQKSRMTSFIPTEYTNLTIDRNGFVYAVSSAYSAEDIAAVIDNNDFSGRVASVRKLNHSGYDILKKNGYFPPMGDVKYKKNSEGTPLVTVMNDIDLGPAETYTVLDYQNGRIITYTQNGDALYYFGSKSNQFGNTLSPAAIAYQGTNILVLDSFTAKITVYTRTEYGTLLIEALEKYNNYEFSESTDKWKQVLELNPNYDIAYNEIGYAMLQKQDYTEAMEYFQRADNMKQYSVAFSEYRDEFLQNKMLYVAAGTALLIILAVILAKFINNVNQKNANNGKKTFGHQLCYSFYIMSHPIEGFWDLLHEKRGSAAVATLMYFLVFLSGTAKKIMTAEMFNDSYGKKLDITQVLLGSAGILLLFVFVNWCLTSLMDGKGTMKDIYISVGYALMPLFIFQSISIPLSYIMTLEENMYFVLINTVGLLWSLGLLFLGVMVTQQYTLLKNTVTCAMSVVGIALVLFIGLLYFSTSSQLLDFIKVLFFEVFRR